MLGVSRWNYGNVIVPESVERDVSPAALKLDVPEPVAPSKTPVPSTITYVPVKKPGFPNERKEPGFSNVTPGKQIVPVSSVTRVLPSVSVIVRMSVSGEQPVSNAVSGSK